MMTQIDQTRNGDAAAEPEAPTGPLVPRGWYPDPQSATQLRWWDGADWTDYLQVPPNDVEAADDESAAWARGADFTPNTAEYEFQYESRPPRPRPSSMGKRPTWETPPRPLVTHTRAAWFISFFPLIWIGVAAGIDFVVVEISGTSIPVAFAAPLLLSTAIAAQYDYLILKRRGFTSLASPFWWLITPLAYLIARTVVLRRIVRRGSAPLWWHLVSSTLAAVIVVSVALFVGGAGSPVEGSASGTSTARIESTLQADYFSQGLLTVAVTCPERADLSAGAELDCTILDAAHLDSIKKAHVVIGSDGTTFSYSTGPPVGL